LLAFRAGLRAAPASSRPAATVNVRIHRRLRRDAISGQSGIGLDDPDGMTIKITPNDKGNPPGKLAEAELHFTEGPLEGLKLIGFSIWERRGGNGRNVTFPARSYVVNGDRRSFALLRPIVDSTAQSKLRDLILEAFQEYEERAAIAS
jgi:hypothetical protein